jgi:hypothetical protein
VNKIQREIAKLVPGITEGMPVTTALELILKELKRLNAEVRKLKVGH